MPVKSIFPPPFISPPPFFSPPPLSLSFCVPYPPRYSPPISLYLSISLLLSGGSFDVNICQLLFMWTRHALQDGIKQSENERCVRYKNDWGGNVRQMHSFGRKKDSASELESQVITPLAVNTSSPLCSLHVFFKKLKTNTEICLPAPQGFTHTPSQRCFSTPLSLASPSFPFSAVEFFFHDFICNQNKGRQCYRSTLCLLNQRPEIYRKELASPGAADNRG